MRKMETLSDFALIVWAKKKEKMKAKQALKSIMVDINDESEGVDGINLIVVVMGGQIQKA